MNHKELNVWKKSMELVSLVYKISSTFPTTEKFGLTSQIRRCAVSISSNIAEGSARKGDKELIQFLYIVFISRIRNPIFNCSSVKVYRNEC